MSPAPGPASPLRRGVAVALFAGVPLLLLALTVGNLVEASQSRGLAARQEATAALIVREVGKREARHLEPRDAAALFLGAGSASLARAELQESTGRFVEAAGGSLEEAQFTSTPEQEGEGAVAIQLSFTIGNDGLRDLLHAVETATPLLDVVELTAKPAGGQVGGQAGGQAGAGEALPHRLHVELTVQGYWRKGTG